MFLVISSISILSTVRSIEFGIGLLELGIDLIELGIGLRNNNAGAPSWPVYPALFSSGQ